MMLLKSEGYSSKEIAVILSANSIGVHNWLKRYAQGGILGLGTKPDQGRRWIQTKDDKILTNCFMRLSLF